MSHKSFSIFKIIEKIVTTVSIIALISTTVLIVAEVVLRKTVNLTIPGLIGIISDYLLVALVFLSISYVYKLNGHVSVTLITRFIPKTVMRPINIIMSTLSLIYFGLIAFYNLRVAMRAIEFKEVSSDILEYPLSPGYLFVTIGCSMLCIRIIQSVIFNFKNNKEGGVSE